VESFVWKIWRYSGTVLFQGEKPMSTRKLYTLMVALGLAMVWLGFLVTYELKIVQPQAMESEQLAPAPGPLAQPDNSSLSIAGFDSGDEVAEAGTGFPLFLAGFGLLLVVVGVVSYRHQLAHKAAIAPGLKM
jgi:hypothetical protein